MKQNILETIVGSAVLVIALFFIVFVMNTDNSANDSDGYVVHARFQNAEGISKGSDIMLAGVKIGSVDNMSLNRDTFYAELNLRIAKDVLVPKDSQAAIVSSGFLGGKFISIIPGVEDENLKDKGKIKYTQSSVNLEALIGKFMYSGVK